jgi:dCTP diphosphatase
MSSLDVDKLKQRLREFAAEREWDQFHSPKNLSMALIAEAAELVEHFQWLTEEQSQNLSALQQEEVALEIADIQLYLIRIADKLSVDIPSAVDRKLKINAVKYPKEKVVGSAKKYTDY